MRFRGTLMEPLVILNWLTQLVWISQGLGQRHLGEPALLTYRRLFNVSIQPPGRPRVMFKVAKCRVQDTKSTFSGSLFGVCPVLRGLQLCWECMQSGIGAAPTCTEYMA